MQNVPCYIDFIKSRGGVTAKEWEWVRNESDDIQYPLALFARADEYLLYPKDENTFINSLFVLVLSLAIMSFVPCGVRFMGLHFSTEIDDFVEVE